MQPKVIPPYCRPVARGATRRARRLARWTDRQTEWENWDDAQAALRSLGPRAEGIVKLVQIGAGTDEIARALFLALYSDEVDDDDYCACLDDADRLAWALFRGHPDVAQCGASRAVARYRGEPAADDNRILEIYSPPLLQAALNGSAEEIEVGPFWRALVVPPPPAKVRGRRIASITLTPRILAQRPFHARATRVGCYS